MNNPRTDKEAKKAWYRAYKDASPEEKKRMRDDTCALNTKHDEQWAKAINQKLKDLKV